MIFTSKLKKNIKDANEYDKEEGEGKENPNDIIKAELYTIGNYQRSFYLEQDFKIIKDLKSKFEPMGITYHMEKDNKGGNVIPFCYRHTKSGEGIVIMGPIGYDAYDKTFNAMEGDCAVIKYNGATEYDHEHKKINVIGRDCTVIEGIKEDKQQNSNLLRLLEIAFLKDKTAKNQISAGKELFIQLTLSIYRGEQHIADQFILWEKRKDYSNFNPLGFYKFPDTQTQGRSR